MQTVPFHFLPLFSQHVYHLEALDDAESSGDSTSQIFYRCSGEDTGKKQSQQDQN